MELAEDAAFSLASRISEPSREDEGMTTGMDVTPSGRLRAVIWIAELNPPPRCTSKRISCVPPRIRLLPIGLARARLLLGKPGYANSATDGAGLEI